MSTIRYLSLSLGATCLVLAAACDSTPTSPDPKTSTTPPAITAMTVTADGSTYLRANLKASVSDADGDLSTDVIDWGDGTTFTAATTPASLTVVHDYPAANRTYQVTVTALDAAQHRVTRTASVNMPDTPHACFDIKVFSACFRVHPNYEAVEFSVSAFDNTLHTWTMSTTHQEASVMFPEAGLRLDLSTVFSRTKGKSHLRVRMYGCTLLLVCTTPIGDKTLTW